MRSLAALTWIVVSIGFGCHAQGFVAPYAGTLYLQCVGGSAGATSQFGVGTTSSNFVPYLKGLPSSCPTAEVQVGAVSAGQAIQFGISTSWEGQTYWAFSSGTDQGSRVAFSDVCNSLGMGGSILQQTSSATWVMHLNDAAHYTISQCEANNILIQVRLAASTAAQPRVGGPLTCTLSTISGPYGCAISGFVVSSTGASPFAEQGTLVADGNGSLVGVATESLGAAIASGNISGTYTINASCAGSATLKNTAGNGVHVAFTVVNNGGQLNFIQSDSGAVISGTAQHLATGCDSSAVSGPYTYAISGWAASGNTFQPFADAGRIIADGSGNLTGKSTYSAAGTIVRRTFSGTYSMGGGCSGAATLIDNLGNTATLTIAVINNGQDVLFIESQTGTAISGRAHRAQFACSSTSLNGGYSFSIDGYAVNANGATVPVADSGLLTSNASGGLSGADAISEGGTVASRQLSGSYSINGDCTGSATLKDNLGNTVDVDVFLGARRVEFIQTDAGAVISGEAQPQSGSCTPADISGAYGYAIEGWTASGQGFVPFADSGQLTANGANSFSGSSTTSLGGSIIGRTFTGTYQTNSDCSGSAVFHDSLGNTANLRFTMSGNGQQLNFIQTDNGTIVSGAAEWVLALPSQAIVNSASFAPGAIAPGSLFSIFGDNLASANTTASSFPLPPQLGGTSVTVNGKAALLYYVSAGFINAQLPVDMPPGSAQLVVTVGGSSSAPVSFTVASAGPGIFTYGLNRAIAANPDGTINGPSSPARTGDTIAVYLTGAGPVQPQIGTWLTGVPALAISPATLPFTAAIGGEPCETWYLGLTPTTVGLYQLNVTIPSLPGGDYTLILTVGGNASNNVLVSIAQ